MRSNLNRDGFVVVPEVLDSSAVAELLAALTQEIQEIGNGAASASRRGDSLYAVRNVLTLSAAARDIALSAVIRRLVASELGTECAAVRGILFDKTPGANWRVVWHQDLSLAVRRRCDIPGWGPWSIKAGVVHVQPPVEVLEKMLTVRLHLDNCGMENGPLRVLPGTHRMGRISRKQISETRDQVPEKVCTVDSGGVLLMRPLLLHASSDARQPGHRRVLHLEFAAGILPYPLEWKEQIGNVT